MRFCNLCSFPLVRINSSEFGLRCIRCRSTFIHRAIGCVLMEEKFASESSVYELSHHGAFFTFLRKNFNHLTYSEYYDDVTPGYSKNGVLCQDIQNLTFDNSSFDLVTSTEVLEHVPDYKRALGEIHRVLRDGGKFIFTVPTYNSSVTSQRATYSENRLIHFKDPVYHGDHLRKKGALVFWEFGSDFIDSIRNSGFDVAVHTIENFTYGIIPPKDVFVAKKI